MEPRGTEIDELTLARSARGDEAACRALVRRYERPVHALLGRMLGPAGRYGLVDDLAQETFLRVFRALPGFRTDGAARLSTWILTIATRLAVDELRKRRPDPSPLDAAKHVADGRRADDASVGLDLATRISRAIGALPPEQRAAFLLREYHELDYAEIARALDADVGTVKSRLSRARVALRAALAEEDR